MSEFVEQELAGLFSLSQPGEWGSDPQPDFNALVLRAADFTKDCKLKPTIGAPRLLPKEKLASRTLREGDLLIEKSGGSIDQPVGRVVYFDREHENQIYAYSNFLQLLRITDGFDKKFVFYLMAYLYGSGLVYRYQQQTTGIFNLKLENYLSETVSLPDCDNVRKKIRQILELIDDAIEQTEALIEKYSLIKAGMMHDLFTRGLTADGKLRPSREEAPGLYKETPIGWIPKNWDAGELKACVRSVQYGISTSLTDAPTGIPVLRMNNIQENAFDVSDMKYADTLEAKALKLSLGDVLYNRTNSMQHVGKTAIWRDELEECSFASYLVRVNLDEKKLDREFFTFWMSQVSSQNALRRYATPAVQQVNINPTNLQKIWISRPSDLVEQTQIVQRVDGLVKKANAEQAKLSKLKVQKSGLMHDLLTGEVPVKLDDAEAAHV